jgi:hypothetical protein
MNVRAAAAALVVVLAGCSGGGPQPKRQREPNRPSIGFIDSPRANAIVGPMFAVAGWALDFDAPVERIRIYLDDQLVATVPLTVLRPDVDKKYSPKIGAGTPHGFSAVIDAGSRAGFTTVRIEALDAKGGLTHVAHTSVKIEP